MIHDHGSGPGRHPNGETLRRNFGSDEKRATPGRRSLGRRYEAAGWNCSVSVEPASAVVSALGEIADVTRSK